MLRSLHVLFLAAWMLIAAGPVLAAGDLVGTLTDFSGTILVRTGGEWGSVPFVGMNLYSGDKVIARDGTAVVTLSDQSTIGVCANTYCYFEEWENDWVLFRRPRGYQRQIVMMYGKINFSLADDKRRMTYTLCTRSLVAGIVGDEDTHLATGNLSTDQDLKNYILFETGRKSYAIGPGYVGVAPDMPIEKVEKLQTFKDALDAANTAAEARKAATAFADGLITAPDRDFLFAKARIASAREARTMAAELSKYNPDLKVMVPRAVAMEKEAATALEEAEALRERAVAAGAVDPEAKAAEEEKKKKEEEEKAKEAEKAGKSPETEKVKEEDIAPAPKPAEEPKAAPEAAPATAPAPEAEAAPEAAPAAAPAPEAAPEAAPAPAPAADSKAAPEAAPVTPAP